MKFLLITIPLLIIAFSFCSCQSSWSSEYRDLYLEACETSGNAMRLDSADRDQYCHCSLKEVMQQYPDMEDAIVNKDSTHMSAALENCMRQAVR